MSTLSLRGCALSPRAHAHARTYVRARMRKRRGFAAPALKVAILNSLSNDRKEREAGGRREEKERHKCALWHPSRRVAIRGSRLPNQPRDPSKSYSLHAIPCNAPLRCVSLEFRSAFLFPLGFFPSKKKSYEFEYN